MLYISTDDGKNKLTCHIILLCNNLKQMCLKLVVGTSLYISKIHRPFTPFHIITLVWGAIGFMSSNICCTSLATSPPPSGRLLVSWTKRSMHRYTPHLSFLSRVEKDSQCQGNWAQQFHCALLSYHNPMKCLLTCKICLDHVKDFAALSKWALESAFSLLNHSEAELVLYTYRRQ